MYYCVGILRLQSIISLYPIPRTLSHKTLQFICTLHEIWIQLFVLVCFLLNDNIVDTLRRNVFWLKFLDYSAMSSLWAEDQGGQDRETRVSICVNVSLDSHTTYKPNKTQSWALYPSALSIPCHFRLNSGSSLRTFSNISI